MLHPNAECSKGNHIATYEARSGVTRCRWCDAVVQPPVVLNTSLSVIQTGNASAKTATTGGCCGDSLTRQANYPRPTITERKDELVTEMPRQDSGTVHEIETRFRKMAQEYAATSPVLVHWKLSGDKLPSVYL